MIRTLTEAAAVCGSSEKEKKKGKCCEGAAVRLVYLFIGTARQLTTRTGSVVL